MRLLLSALLLCASPAAALVSLSRVAPLLLHRASLPIRACADDSVDGPADGRNARFKEMTPQGAVADVFRWIDRPVQMNPKLEAVYKGVVRTALFQGPILLVSNGLARALGDPAALGLLRLTRAFAGFSFPVTQMASTLTGVLIAAVPVLPAIVLTLLFKVVLEMPRFATAMIAGVPVSEVGPVLRSNPIGTVYEEWLAKTLKASKAYFAQLREAFTAMGEAAKSIEAGAEMTPAVARFMVMNVAYTIVLIVPIVEEFVYRALLQQQLQRLANERWVQDGDSGRDEAKVKVATRAAHVVCSIIFGLAHVPVMEVVADGCSAQNHIRQAFLATFASLLIYCPLYTKYGVLASTVAHMTWNVVASVYGLAKHKVILQALFG